MVGEITLAALAILAILEFEVRGHIQSGIVSLGEHQVVATLLTPACRIPGRSMRRSHFY
jgi:hypothetical protein